MPKTIIITGASKGLGLAIATYIVTHGHNAILIARSADLLSQIQSSHPDRIRYLAGDLSTSSSCPSSSSSPSLAQQAVTLAIRTFGGLDGLILNHGILGSMKPIADTTASEWRHAYETNVFSAVEFIAAALPELRKRSGAVLVTSSGASRKNTHSWGVYASSKAVLDHLVGTLAEEEREVTALAIAPGTVDTEMQREIREVHGGSLLPGDAERYMSLHREGKLLRPEVPGSLMARLALDPPRALSGKYFRWDVPELTDYRKDDD